MYEYSISTLSESCLVINQAGEVNEEQTRFLLGLFYELQEKETLKVLGVVDLVPAYTSLAVHFQGSEFNADAIEETLHEWITVWTPEPYRDGRMHEIPVHYDGLDLEEVARQTHLSVEELIRLHTEPDYFVAMIGFKPHFPYLMGLDPRLETPRLENPRASVPAGAVGIGGNQTGVYPKSSPGGWNLIGHADPACLKNIQPGDQVRFIREEAS